MSTAVVRFNCCCTSRLYSSYVGYCSLGEGLLKFGDAKPGTESPMDELLPPAAYAATKAAFDAAAMANPLLACEGSRVNIVDPPKLGLRSVNPTLVGALFSTASATVAGKASLKIPKP